MSAATLTRLPAPYTPSMSGMDLSASVGTCPNTGIESGRDGVTACVIGDESACT